MSLAAFVMVEARFAEVPLTPLRLFRLRAIAVGNVAILLAGACLNPMWFFLTTLCMQNVLYYDPLMTGLGFLPHTVVAMIVGRRLTPWLMRRIDSRGLIMTGALVASVSGGRA